MVDRADRPRGELVATAVLPAFGADARTVRIVACGQPGLLLLLLLRDGRAVEPDVEPGTPLGPGLAGAVPPASCAVPPRPGDRLILAPGGVTEARGTDGASSIRRPGG
ncbi:SpoIIE family protein phosphatase [Streptomyces sp. NPDC085946]|uniref:SpoIIE family protein phosphatase n=1 Tax=Streptomyces sp. NPDC085946 TaxID=3365744 RepID=UPI0037D31811